MLLRLTKILDQPGASIPFTADLDLSNLEFGGCRPVEEPVHAAGEVKNTAGVLILTGTISTTLHCVCDRCCRPYTEAYVHQMEAVLTPALADAEHEDENIFELVGEEADLEEIVNTQFVLSMDSKMLCSEDCKGLCPRCGANLNDGPCGCKKEIDPRLAALAQLLKDKEV